MGGGAGRTPAQPGRRGRFLELVAAGRAGVRTTGLPPPAGGDPLCLAGCGRPAGSPRGAAVLEQSVAGVFFLIIRFLAAALMAALIVHREGVVLPRATWGLPISHLRPLSFRLSERCTWTLTLPPHPTSSQARAAQRPGVTPSGSQAPTSEQNSTCHETVFLRAGGGVVRCKGCWRLAALGPDLASPFSAAWGGLQQVAEPNRPQPESRAVGAASRSAVWGASRGAARPRHVDTALQCPPSRPGLASRRGRLSVTL